MNTPLGSEQNPVILPKGSYSIGDPTLLIPEAELAEALKTSQNFSHPRGFFIRKDELIEIHAFPSSQNNVTLTAEPFPKPYKVHSGLIAIIRDSASVPNPGTHLHHFTHNFSCFIKEGVIHFGLISIDTLQDPEDRKTSRYQPRHLLDPNQPPYFQETTEEGLEDEQTFSDSRSEDREDF